MYILNTTFIMDKTLSGDILVWIRDSYAAAARHASKRDDILVTKVLTAQDPGVETYAVHTPFDTMADAEKWRDGAGARLREILTRRHGEKALTFCTLLEVVN